MKLKFINTLDGQYKGKKRLYRVYATYNYLGEVFFCVKARKFNYDSRYGKWKYVYLEPKTGMKINIPFGRDKILTRREFVRFIRKQLKISRRSNRGNNIREVVRYNIYKYCERCEK